MKRLVLLLILATSVLAQDVYVPPVPIGIRGEGKVRKPKSPIQFPDPDSSWIRIRSEHYDTISSAGEEQTRAIVNDLETLAAVLTKSSPRFRVGATPTTILVFSDRKESLPFFELLLGHTNPTATGLYVRHGGGGTMFVDASRKRQRIEKTAMHELVHDLLRQGEDVPPLWIEEGLAEYFSTAEIRDGRVLAGQPIAEHLSLLRRKKMPLEQIFTIKAETEASFAHAFYAESWAAVEWLMRGGQEKFFAFLRDIERGTSIANALQTNYGKTLKEMEKELQWSGGRSGHRIEIEGGRSGHPSTSTSVPRPALLYELGKFLSHVSGAEEDAQRFYREALRIDPRHARSLAATGQFEEAIAAGLDDGDVHLAYAETLMTSVLGPFAGIFEPEEGDVDKFRKARVLAERALVLGADEGSTRAALGASYLIENDVAPGITHLQRAYALLPRRADVALNLYSLLLRTDQRAAADELYANAFANARDKQLIFAAKNVLVMNETNRANALAKQGKLDEAAAIVRALAASTEDSLGRRELEQQAAQLESTAAVNRHIRMYNEAVTLANTGRNRDAVKMLDQLLLVATDVVVVRDARKLREEVRKR